MKQLLIISFLFFSVYVQAQDVDVDSTLNLSLEKCVQMALRNNADINNSNFQSQQSKAYRTQAQAALFPSVNGSIDHSLNSGRNINSSDNSYSTQSFTSANYNLSANVPIFNAFKYRNNIKKTDLDFKASQYDLKNMKDQITLQVIVAYLNVLNQEDQLENYQQQLLSTQAQMNRLDSMNKAGAAKPDDIANMQGQLSGNQIAIVQQENAVKDAKITLFNLMNVPVNTDAVLDRPQSLTDIQLEQNGSVDDIYARSLQNLPMIKEAELQEQSAYKYVQINKADYYPYLQFGAGIATTYTNTATDNFGNKIGYFNQLKNNYGTYFGLTLNIPIFNGLQTRTNVKVAKILAAKATFNTKTVKNNLKSNIVKASSDADAALNAWQQQQKQVDAYKELMRVDEIKFNAGAINATDYLVDKTKFEQAEITLIVDKYTYIFNTKVLSYYQGELSF
ncbi:TolC family protein [Arachidicoccus ginsenosidimutans]|uniref:TolC family protein n=1 Tax=Arachidicoccus sp. BS20 TaxID=1850526 RepID=UPI0018D2C1A5|nr:TolC family protein [Arachidicoccus sp. BS20]